MAWFAGTAEGAKDSCIWLTRCRDTNEWESPRRVFGADDDDPWWNPVLAISPRGALTLFAHRGQLISEWQTMFSTSYDEGRTWSPVRELVPGDRGGRGPVRTPPVRTPQGAWLAPSSIESGGASPVWDAFFDRSEDDGTSWTAAPVPLERDGKLSGPGVIQPALWFHGDRAIALLRTGEGHAFRTLSDDDGRTWATARPIALPQNNSGMAAAALPDGRAALVHNPVGDAWGRRCPLSISVSDDDGMNWTRLLDLDDGLAAPSTAGGLPLPWLPSEGAPGFRPSDSGVETTGLGEYSYPTVCVEPDGSLAITYTWQRRGIVYAHVPAKALF